MSSQKKSKNKIIIIAVVVVTILIVLHIITGFVLFVAEQPADPCR